jgi:hypothetical protein
LDGFLVVAVFALTLLVNELRPFFGTHFLVRHKGEFLGLDFSRINKCNNCVIQVAINGAQSVLVELLEMAIVPRFHDFAVRGLPDGVVEDAYFEIGGESLA